MQQIQCGLPKFSPNLPALNRYTSGLYLQRPDLSLWGYPDLLSPVSSCFPDNLCHRSAAYLFCFESFDRVKNARPAPLRVMPWISCVIEFCNGKLLKKRFIGLLHTAYLSYLSRNRRHSRSRALFQNQWRMTVAVGRQCQCINR